MPEFLFNEDAFDFFSKKIPEESCIFNLHNLFLNTPVLAIFANEKANLSSVAV